MVPFVYIFHRQTDGEGVLGDLRFGEPLEYPPGF